MSIHRVSPFASKAASVLVLLSIDVMLGAAAAESPVQAAPSTTVNVSESQGGAQRRSAAGACRVIDRPKHKIVQCDCSSDPLASISSVDMAAMLRLFVGNPRCRAPVAARE